MAETRIKIDLERHLGEVDRNLFGGFAEHLGRCIYGGIFEPDSPHADGDGFRRDVLDALRRLQMPVIRYPGGNFVSGYRWRDGVGPVGERPARTELAWHDVEPNTFGTDEFVRWCRRLGAEPYLVVNCGDGGLREARDWLEYCNGTQDTALVRLRRSHGFEQPHNVKYWGIGNEVDGPWQIGYKTPQEYARAYTEYAKVMKRTDPSIKLLASAVSLWEGEWVERTQLLLEGAGDLVDYLALHWYVGNQADDFAAYMATSELIEARLGAFEGLVAALRLANGLKRPVHLAVDEYNVWYRAFNEEKLEEVFNLEDALVIALHLNAFIRHAGSVKLANFSQVVNVVAPLMTRPDGLVLQTTFYPFELYSRLSGDRALDVHWAGATFEGGGYTGVRTLDVAATLNRPKRQLALFVVNRHPNAPLEATVALSGGCFRGPVEVHTVNGPDVKAQNTFAAPDRVGTRSAVLAADTTSLTHSFEPHSVTALVGSVR